DYIVYDDKGRVLSRRVNLPDFHKRTTVFFVERFRSLPLNLCQGVARRLLDEVILVVAELLQRRRRRTSVRPDPTHGPAGLAATRPIGIAERVRQRGNRGPRVRANLAERRGGAFAHEGVPALQGFRQRGHGGLRLGPPTAESVSSLDLDRGIFAPEHALEL